MSALPKATTKSASGSATSGMRISKATIFRATPAAISTAAIGARPIGPPNTPTFKATLKNAWKSVDLKEPQGWRDLVEHGIKGFRAPYLSATAGGDMIAAEKKAGFSYDASLVTKGPATPVVEDGIIRFGLPLIPEGPKEKPVIGMDYNLFIRHSKGEEDKTDSKVFEERAYAAFKEAFDKQYAGDRIPLQLGFHFVEMNGGAYWRALDRLVSAVCRRTDVACVSYAEAIPMIEARGKLREQETSGL